MQIDTCRHEAEESIKCLIYDCLKTQTIFKQIHDGLIVKMTKDHQTQIYHLDEQYKNIRHSFSICKLESICCIAYGIVDQHQYFVYAAQNFVTFKLFKLQNHEEIQQKSKNIPLPSQKIISMSQPLCTNKYDIIIAITQSKNLYSILIKHNQSVQILKVINNQEKFIFLNFQRNNTLNKSKRISLHICKLENNDQFVSCLVVDNKNIKVLLIQLLPENNMITFKDLKEFKQIYNILPYQAFLIQNLVACKSILHLNHMQLVLSYDTGQQIIIFFLNIQFSQEKMFELIKLPLKIPNSHFQVILIANSLVYSYFDKQSNNYHVKRLKIRPTLDHEQNLFKSSQRLFLCKYGNKLYINTIKNNFKIQFKINSASQSQQQSDLSQFSQKLMTFKKNLQKEYEGKLSKYWQNFEQNKSKIIEILRQKLQAIQLKVNQQLQQKSDQKQNKFVVLTIQILKIHIILYFVQKQWPKVHQYLNKKSNKKYTYSDICKCQISFIQSFINFSIIKSFKFLIQILKQIEQKVSHNKIFIQAYKIIFSQLFQTIMSQLITNSENMKKKIDFIEMTELFKFEIRYQFIYFNSFIDGLIAKYPDQLRKSILDTESHQLFIDTYIKSNYNSQQLSTIFKKIHSKNPQDFKPSLKKILKECEKAYKNTNKSILLQKLNVILEGLYPFEKQIVSVMKKHFPGILIFYYMKNEEAQLSQQLIKQMGKKNNSQFNTYLISISKRNRGIITKDNIMRSKPEYDQEDQDMFFQYKDEPEDDESQIQNFQFQSIKKEPKEDNIFEERSINKKIKQQ